MIGYDTFGTNDLPRACVFYDALLGQLGAKRIMESDRFVFWGVSPKSPALGLIKPFDGQPASAGNGAMVALVVDARAKVDSLHAKALSLGGTDEGAPGDRGVGYHAAYFRDFDGNKPKVFCMG